MQKWDAPLIQSACRQCWIEACWGDAGAIQLCSMLLERVEPPVPVQELLKRCREGDLADFGQALLWLQQQVEIEILKPQDSSNFNEAESGAKQ